MTKDEKTAVPRLPIHDLGALRGLTRWINKQEEGIAELLKNVRLAYHENRANVKPEHRVAVILIKNADKDGPAKIGVLDVGGFTFEDVKNWSVWNKPDASSRGGPKDEETQGNGGKAYMYRLFEGPAFICGIKNNKKNQAGFIGERGSLERGLPRFYPASKREIWQIGDIINPNNKERDVVIKDWKEELINHLINFNTGFYILPEEVKEVLEQRKSFTLVQGEDPINWGWEKNNIKNLIMQIIRHPQSTRAMRQVKFYVICDGNLLFNGNPLELEKIEPYPGFGGPFEYPIPKTLLTPDGNQINTTKSSRGACSDGKIILFTSKDSMEASYKTLKPRWTVNYRTKYEDVGKKNIPEIVPSTPGSHFIYAEVHLDALSPDSVDSGRKRPNDTLLVLAVDKFLSEKISDLSKKINDLQIKEISESILDEIQKENKYLNDLKNEFLPKGGSLDLASLNGEEGGGKNKKSKRKVIEWGENVVKIEVDTYALKIACGVKINLKPLLKPSAKDIEGKPVAQVVFEWKSDNEKVLYIDKDGNCEAKNKGTCKIQISIAKTNIMSFPIEVDVWQIKEIILSPRNLEIPLGHIKQILAQVVNDKKQKSTVVLLNWIHDADNQNLIKISPKGFIFGNMMGKTCVKAGGGDFFCTNPCEVEIVKGEKTKGKGSGYPQLFLTGKDIDPFTSIIRQGDPEAPTLWQEPWDVQNNIWWLNLQSKDAFFAYNQRKNNPSLWRLFHSKILVEMMIQVHMQDEYTSKEDGEKPALWSDHKGFYDRKYVELAQAMWAKLDKYVEYGKEEE